MEESSSEVITPFNRTVPYNKGINKKAAMDNTVRSIPIQSTKSTQQAGPSNQSIHEMDIEYHSYATRLKYVAYSTQAW